MLVVQHLPTDVTLDLRHLSALLLIVIRPLLLARQIALLALESFILVFEVEPVHGLPIARVDVIQNTEVNPDAVARVQRVRFGFLGEVSVVGFETGGDEPVTGRLFFDRDFFDVHFVGDVAVVADFDVTEFGNGVCTRSRCCRRPRFRTRTGCSCTLGDECRCDIPVQPLPLVSGMRGSGDYIPSLSFDWRRVFIMVCVTSCRLQPRSQAPGHSS